MNFLRNSLFVICSLLSCNIFGMQPEKEKFKEPQVVVGTDEKKDVQLSNNAKKRLAKQEWKKEKKNASKETTQISRMERIEREKQKEMVEKNKIFSVCLAKANEAMRVKDFQAFDMACGDNACQVRAHKLFCIALKCMGQNILDPIEQKSEKNFKELDCDEKFLTACFFGKEFGGLKTDTDKLDKFVKASGCDAMAVKKLRNIGKENTDMCMGQSEKHLLALADKVCAQHKGRELEPLVLDLKESLKQIEKKKNSEEKTSVNPRSCATISSMMLILFDLLARDKVVCLKCTNICESGVFVGKDGKPLKIAKTDKNLFFRPNKEKTDFEMLDEDQVAKIQNDLPVFVLHGLIFNSSDEGCSNLEGLMKFFEDMGFGRNEDEVAIEGLPICRSDCLSCKEFVGRIKRVSLLNDIIFPNSAQHKQFPDATKTIEFEGDEFIGMRPLKVLKEKFEGLKNKPGVSRDDMSLFMIDHVFVSLKGKI